MGIVNQTEPEMDAFYDTPLDKSRDLTHYVCVASIDSTNCTNPPRHYSLYYILLY